MYLPSFPRYALTPESTLTPAPVSTAARPDERKAAMRWTASEGDTVGALRWAAVERMPGGMFGTDRRIGGKPSQVASSVVGYGYWPRAVKPVRQTPSATFPAFDSDSESAEKLCIQPHPPPCSTRLDFRSLTSLGHLSTPPALQSHRPQTMASLETAACISPLPCRVPPGWQVSSWTSCKSAQVFFSPF